MITLKLTSQNRKFTDRDYKKNVVYITGDSVTQNNLEQTWQLQFYFLKNKKKYPVSKSFMKFKDFKQINWDDGNKDTLVCSYKFHNKPLELNNEIEVSCCDGEAKVSYSIIKLTDKVLQLNLYFNVVRSQQHPDLLEISRMVFYRVNN